VTLGELAADVAALIEQHGADVPVNGYSDCHGCSGPVWIGHAGALNTRPYDDEAIVIVIEQEAVR